MLHSCSAASVPLRVGVEPTIEPMMVHAVVWLAKELMVLMVVYLESIVVAFFLLMLPSSILFYFYFLLHPVFVTWHRE